MHSHPANVMIGNNETSSLCETRREQRDNDDDNDDDAIGPFDVLCGRDKQSFNHVGNRRFRVIINMNLQRYLDTKSRFERSEMILALVRELRGEAGMRFIKRRGCQLIELNDKLSREKVGHALRDAASQHAGTKGGSSKSSPSATKKKNSKSTDAKKQAKNQRSKMQNQPNPIQPACDDEFSLSDESMVSLLSLIDENTMQQNNHDNPIDNNFETLAAFFIAQAQDQVAV